MGQFFDCAHNAGGHSCGRGILRTGVIVITVHAWASLTIYNWTILSRLAGAGIAGSSLALSIYHPLLSLLVQGATSYKSNYIKYGQTLEQSFYRAKMFSYIAGKNSV